ncbi:MAG: ATP-dependent DNA helicase RecG [bacterium]|nr:ATP-dependent DNA helicase RecG [bacterium]
MNDLNKDVQYLKGVGPQRAKLLKDIGILTVYDLLTYFPRDYADRSRLKLIAQLHPGETTTIQATVLRHQVIYTRFRKQLLKITVSDGTGTVILVCFNQVYLKDYLPQGTTVIISGKFERSSYKKNAFEIKNFVYEILTGDHEDLIHTGRIVPVYSITERLNMRFLRTLIRRALDEYKGDLSEYLPETIRKQEFLLTFKEAVEWMHFPPDFPTQQQARERLVFGELFLLETALAMKHFQQQHQTNGIAYVIHKTLLTTFKELLPFEFTADQKKVIGEIFADMQSPRVMNRLLQGDVGSGKTIVSLCAMLLAAENKYQSVLMAPTEILAEQHFIYLQKYLQPLGLNAVLFTSGMDKKILRQNQESLAQGTAQVAIGTHALLEEDVVFQKLGLIVVDEQHRFGVTQRALLRQKGHNPDVLVMTATPIPRSLALTIYGDLDVSIIRELPPGRKPVKTQKVNELEAYRFIKDEITGGHQAFMVYPLIEESPKFTLKAAKKMAQDLQEKIFPEFRVGLLHGRLKVKDKEQIMQDFVEKKIDLLVATTVVEVGIDVANATVIMIEHAERFGLATLHQLRGRVGRSSAQSYCLLSADDKTEDARSRIRAMLETTDGFRIAEEDLKIRGPGEFFGVRQSGLPEFKVADLLRDFALLAHTRELSFHLVQQDPRLVSLEHRLLAAEIRKIFGSGIDFIHIG